MRALEFDRGRIRGGVKGRWKESLAIVFCLSLICGGLYACISFSPELKKSFPGHILSNTTIIPGGHSAKISGPLKENIMTELLPEWLGLPRNVDTKADSSFGPHSEEHWTPIRISSMEKDMMFEMCQLHFKDYSSRPHRIAKFSDLVRESSCEGSNLKSVRRSQLKSNLANAVDSPSGFFFHLSPLGSRLICNILASDPLNMVFCEPSPPAAVLLRCHQCSHQDYISRFRDVVETMSQSPIHRRVFFVFSPITLPRMRLALEAFPNTPWVFVYQNPIDILAYYSAFASDDDQICSRNHGTKSKKQVSYLRSHGVIDAVAPFEATCAAQLAILQEHALDAYDALGNTSRNRAVFVNYDSISHVYSTVLYPHFGLKLSEWNPSTRVVIFRAFEAKRKMKFQSRISSDLVEISKKMLLSVYKKLSALSSSELGAGNGITGDLPTLKREALPSYVYEPFYSSHNSTPYEVVECPAVPPINYPITYDMKRILSNWNPDDVTIPPINYDSICRFDFQGEYEKALAYRNAEKPFIVYNVPEVEQTVQSWGDLDHLHDVLKDMGTSFRAETSTSNHFMYWRKKHHQDKNWTPPTGERRVSFVTWLKSAVENFNKSADQRELLYFHVNGRRKGDPIFKELPFFNPEKSLFIVEPEEQRGINCRFGMSSIIAECHFDGSRNFVANLGGMRRFILAHPNQCEDMYLYPSRHPSGRHSMIDWSRPDYNQYKKFSTVQANEVITTPGDVLYLPTYWFHFIVSLNVNFQCNTRSGISLENDAFIEKCGYH